MERNEILAAILRKQPKIHCLTNPVTMNDVANILLAAGGSAVMAQDEQEAAEITTFCQGTLLNTGVPDEAKIRACILAGKRANQLGHPVVLDPVGVGGSSFRRRELRKLLDHVHPAVVRCNQEEAAVLCSFHSEQETHFSHGGVESSLHMDAQNLTQLARTAADFITAPFLLQEKQMSYQTANRPFCLVAAIQGSAGSRAAAACSLPCVPCSVAAKHLPSRQRPRPVSSGRKFQRKPEDIQIRIAAASDSSTCHSWI